MTTELDLTAVLTATVVGTTATSNSVGPTANEEWEVRRYSVTLSSGFGDCKVYRNNISPSTVIDTTEDGHSATSENNSIQLKPGERILVQWTDCTVVGAVGTMPISGVRKVKGNRAY